MLYTRPQTMPAAVPRLVPDVLEKNDPLRGAVLMLGNFDGFHRGHRALYHVARHIAASRPLALMSCEPHPRSFFAPDATEPFRLTTPATKVAMLAPFGFDYIFTPRFDAAFAGLSAQTFIHEMLADGLGVDHVVTGGDFRFGRGRGGDVAMLVEAGRFGVTAVAEVTEGDERCSSSLVRALLRDGRLEEANRVLGQPWTVELERSEDARLRLSPMLCRPAPGRYLAQGAQGRMTLDIGPDGGVSGGFGLRPGLYRLLGLQD